LQTTNIISKLLKSPITKTLVYANVFIAICSLSQVFVTYSIFQIPTNFKNNSYLLFVLLSTYLQYNVQRGYMISQTNQASERSRWLTKHKKLLLITVALCVIIVLFLCNNLSYTSIGIMVGAEVVSTLYYLPPFNFRKYGYVKPFLIAAIWVISCSAVPLIENKLLTLNSVWFLVSQFCFVATLCAVFDIKDAEEDYLNGVNTYANRFGIAVTKTMCIILMLLSSVCYVFFKHGSQSLLLISCLVSVITISSILLTTDKKHSFYYYLWIDGLLIIQAVLLLLV
jgi:4-hydroxybenzoate polyprenyltransferase